MSEPPEGPRPLPGDRSNTEHIPIPGLADYEAGGELAEREPAELAEHQQAAEVADARERMPPLYAAREEIGRHFDVLKQRARAAARIPGPPAAPVAARQNG